MTTKLTEEQKKRFEEAFTAFIQQAPPGLQQLWDGTIGWSATGEPVLNKQLLQMLTGEWAAGYVRLMKSLRKRSI